MLEGSGTSRSSKLRLLGIRDQGFSCMKIMEKRRSIMLVSSAKLGMHWLKLWRRTDNKDLSSVKYHFTLSSLYRGIRLLLLILWHLRVHNTESAVAILAFR